MHTYKHVTPVHIKDSNNQGIYIGRNRRGLGRNIYENPYPVEEYGRDAAIKMHLENITQKLINSKMQVEDILMLRGKRLVCFCYPKQCHAENYDKIIEGLDDLGITTNEQFLTYIRSKVK